MGSYDHWKETEPDREGPACDLCNDEAVYYVSIQGTPTPVFLCRACEHDKVTRCEGCNENIWQSVGYRIHGTGLECPSCAATHPGLILGRAIEAKRDEERDDFNEVRR